MIPSHVHNFSTRNLDPVDAIDSETRNTLSQDGDKLSLDLLAFPPFHFFFLWARPRDRGFLRAHRAREDTGTFGIDPLALMRESEVN